MAFGHILGREVSSDFVVECVSNDPPTLRKGWSSIGDMLARYDAQHTHCLLHTGASSFDTVDLGYPDQLSGLAEFMQQGGKLTVVLDPASERDQHHKAQSWYTRLYIRLLFVLRNGLSGTTDQDERDGVAPINTAIARADRVVDEYQDLWRRQTPDRQKDLADWWLWLWCPPIQYRVAAVYPEQFQANQILQKQDLFNYLAECVGLSCETIEQHRQSFSPALRLLADGLRIYLADGSTNQLTPFQIVGFSICSVFDTVSRSSRGLYVMYRTPRKDDKSPRGYELSEVDQRSGADSYLNLLRDRYWVRRPIPLDPIAMP